MEISRRALIGGAGGVLLGALSVGYCGTALYTHRFDHRLLHGLERIHTIAPGLIGHGNGDAPAPDPPDDPAPPDPDPSDTPEP